MRCAAKKGKICIHVVPKYANCGGNHQATAFRCPARQKAQAVAWKNKEKKVQDREERESLAERHGDLETLVEIHDNKESTSKPVKMDLDTHTNWAGSLGHFSDFSSVEDSAPENAQEFW